MKLLIQIVIIYCQVILVKMLFNFKTLLVISRKNTIWLQNVDYGNLSISIIYTELSHSPAHIDCSYLVLMSGFAVLTLYQASTCYDYTCTIKVKHMKCRKIVSSLAIFLQLFITPNLAIQTSSHHISEWLFFIDPFLHFLHT